MTVGERKLKSAVVASLELSLRKVRGLFGGTISDMIVFCWFGTTVENFEI